MDCVADDSEFGERVEDGFDRACWVNGAVWEEFGLARHRCGVYRGEKHVDCEDVCSDFGDANV